MSDAPIIPDDELHAFIDGALDEDRAQTVRQAMSQDAALAERIAAFQADKAMLKTLFGPVAERPLPQEWTARIRQRRRVDWRWAYGIAAALLVAVATPLAWRQALPSGGDVVEAALDSRDAGQSCSAGSTAGQYEGALRQAVSTNLHVPDLGRMGYKFCGLQRQGKAAVISYRGPENQLFTLYVRASDGSVRFDQFQRRGLRVCIWQDDQISTVMAGNVSAAAMQRLATLSYTGLTT